MSKKDLHRAHQYLYYVACLPVLSDLEFDMLEKEVYPDGNAPIGSDQASDYSDEIKQLAESLNIQKAIESPETNSFNKPPEIEWALNENQSTWYFYQCAQALMVSIDEFICMSEEWAKKRNAAYNLKQNILALANCFDFENLKVEAEADPRLLAKRNRIIYSLGLKEYNKLTRAG